MLNLKKISFYLGCVILSSVLFWLVGFVLWGYLFRSNPGSSAENISRAEQERMYSEQLIQADKQLELSASQIDRMDQLISRQEKQMDRYDAILKRWEKQGGIVNVDSLPPGSK